MYKHRKDLWFSEVSYNVQAQEILVIQRSQLQCPSTGKTCDSAKSATMLQCTRTGNTCNSAKSATMYKHRKDLWFSEVSYNVQAQEILVIQRSQLQCTSTGKTCVIQRSQLQCPSTGNTCNSAKSATMYKHRKDLWFSEVSCNVQAQERLVIQRSQLQCTSTGNTCNSAKSATMYKHRKYL